MEEIIEELKKGNKVVGLNQTLKEIEAGNAKKVFLASDADRDVQRTVRGMCGENNISLVEVDSMKTLGKACGIDVKAAVAGVL